MTNNKSKIKYIVKYTSNQPNFSSSYIYPTRIKYREDNKKIDDTKQEDTKQEDRRY